MNLEINKNWKDMTIDEQFDYVDETYNEYGTMTNKDFFKRGVEVGAKKEMLKKEEEKEKKQ